MVNQENGITTDADTTPLRKTCGTLLSLGVPLAIGFVSQMAISFTDAALVARLGTVEFAGVTLALSVFSVVMLLGLGVVSAVSPMVATAFRMGSAEQARRWYAQGTWLSVALGLVGAMILLNTGEILTLVGQRRELADVAQQYNTGAALGLPFFLLYVNVRSTLSSVGRPKLLTWIMLAAVPVNIGVGYLAIFGVGGVPGFGVAGAGWSSTVVRGLIIVAALAVMHWVVFPGRIPWRPDARLLRELVRVGAPIGVRILLGEGFLPVLMFFVAHFGAEATTAHAVALRLVSLISVIALGFSSAAGTMSAWARADGRPGELRGLLFALLLVGGGYAVVLSAATAVAFGFVVDVFGLQEMGAESTLHALLPLVLGYFVLDTLGAVFNGYLVGMQDTLLPTVVVMISFWGVGLGIGLLLSGPAGLTGLWIGLVVAASLVAAFNITRASRHARIGRSPN